MVSNLVLYMRLIIGFVFLFFSPYMCFRKSYKIVSLVRNKKYYMAAFLVLPITVMFANGIIFLTLALLQLSALYR